MEELENVSGWNDLYSYAVLWNQGVFRAKMDGETKKEEKLLKEKIKKELGKKLINEQLEIWKAWVPKEEQRLYEKAIDIIKGEKHSSSKKEKEKNENKNANSAKNEKEESKRKETNIEKHIKYQTYNYEIIGNMFSVLECYSNKFEKIKQNKQISFLLIITSNAKIRNN